MTGLYLIPDRAQPITLDELRRAFPAIAWANADAGGPDGNALALVGGSIAPQAPPHDPAVEFIVWNGDGWTVVPLPLTGDGGSVESSSGGSYA